MSHQESFQIFEERPDHSYRTEIPKIISLLGLDPYEYRLYCHYKEVSGDAGCCFQSIDTVEKATGMKETKFRESHKKLKQHFEILGGKSLIRSYQTKKEDGSNGPVQVMIVDIWRENGDFFRSKKSTPPLATRATLPRHASHPPSPNEDKEDLSKEDPFNKLFVAEGGCPPSASENSSSSSEKKEEQRVEASIPHSHTITTTGGVKKTITESDVYLMASKKRTEWTVEELKYSWVALCSYKGIIHDWTQFIGGTIDKYRNTKKSEEICKKGRKEKKTLNDSKERTSENVTAEQVLAQLGGIGRLMKKSQDG